MASRGNRRGGQASATFFFCAPPASELYTLSLHDALPIFSVCCSSQSFRRLWSICPGHVKDSNPTPASQDRKSTRLNSSHVRISYAVFCLKKKNNSRTGPYCRQQHDARRRRVAKPARATLA